MESPVLEDVSGRYRAVQGKDKAWVSPRNAQKATELP